MKNKIDNRIKSERVKQLIILSEKLKTKFYNKFQNSIKEVLFEKVNKKWNDVWIYRQLHKNKNPI